MRRGTPRSVVGRGGHWPERFEVGGMHALLASTERLILFLVFFYRGSVVVVFVVVFNALAHKLITNVTVGDD